MLAAELQVTTGTMSVRLDRLQRAGLVMRSRSAADGRARPVRLTRAGHRTWAKATAARTALEARLLTTALRPRDIRALNWLLRSISVAIERDRGPAPRRGATGE